MGWNGGSAIAEDLWKTFRQYVPADKRKALAREIIDRFEAEDADTMDEALTLCEDAEVHCKGCYGDCDICGLPEEARTPR